MMDYHDGSFSTTGWVLMGFMMFLCVALVVGVVTWFVTVRRPAPPPPQLPAPATGSVSTTKRVSPGK